MSGGQSGYELSEAKAILKELKSIRKAISSGEKEKQDLMQVCDRTFFWVKSNYYYLLGHSMLLNQFKIPWRSKW